MDVAQIVVAFNDLKFNDLLQEVFVVFEMKYLYLNIAFRLLHPSRQ